MIFLSFVVTIILGYFILLFLRRFHMNQSLNRFLREDHKKKEGTPTMGGLIFIIPSILIISLLFIFHKINFSYNLLIVLLTFIFYMFIGLIDDLLIIVKHNNKGLTKKQKLVLQIIQAIVIFYLYLKADNEPLIWFHLLNIRVNLGFIYGIIILFILVGMSNAVNLTDGLDGLASGLSIFNFIAFSFIILRCPWLEGYKEIYLFLQILIGSLLGFLVFNKYPAKVFMGDTGSLALGALIGILAIITKEEEILLIIGLPFIIETLSVIIQVIYYKLTKKRFFLMAPLHHHLERKNYSEIKIVLMFYLLGLVLLFISFIYGDFL